jgi:hypothetical protein
MNDIENGRRSAEIASEHCSTAVNVKAAIRLPVVSPSFAEAKNKLASPRQRGPASERRRERGQRFRFREQRCPNDADTLEDEIRRGIDGRNVDILLDRAVRAAMPEAGAD